MSSLNSFLESISPQQLFDDPYPVYERLRKEAPVAYIPQLRTYWITRYDDVAKVVAEEDGWATSTGVEGHPLRRTLGDPVITMVGGETHDDLRIGVDKTLRPPLYLGDVRGDDPADRKSAREGTRRPSRRRPGH